MEMADHMGIDSTSMDILGTCHGNWNQYWCQKFAPQNRTHQITKEGEQWRCDDALKGAEDGIVWRWDLSDIFDRKMADDHTGRGYGYNMRFAIRYTGKEQACPIARLRRPR